MQLGLHRAGLAGRKHRQIIDTVGLGTLPNFDQFGLLLRQCGDDEFAATAVRHPVLLTEAIELPAALDTETRLEGAGRIIDSRVNHLAVARTGLRAKFTMAFQDQHLSPGPRQRPRTSEADYARTNNDRLNPMGHAEPQCFY